jgi:hypothetical protein
MTPARQTECKGLDDYILSLEECKTPEESVKLAFEGCLR